MEKVSIIIPAYNEERRIENTLKKYSEFFGELKKKRILDFEIIVIINNTTDKTEKIVSKYSKQKKEIRYLNFKQSGKGFAIIKGFKDALKRKNELIGFVDADMSTKPEAFFDLIKHLGDNDCVIASRYVKGAIVSPKQSFGRIFFSRIFNIFIRAILGIHYKDTQCGAKILKRNSLKKIISHLNISRWAFDIDLLYNLKKNKCRVREIPTTWRDAEYSVINFSKAGPMMGLAVIRLRILNSFFKDFVKIYDKIVNKFVMKDIK